MATNFIALFDPIDLFNGGVGGNALAITDPLDTISLGPGLRIEITEPLDTASIHGIAEPNFIAIQDPLDTISISALEGQIGKLKVKDPLDTFAGQGYSQILGNMSLIDPLDRILIQGLSGVIGSILLTDPIDIISIQELPQSHGTLAVTDPIDFISLNGRVYSVTYNRRAVVMHLFSHAVSEYENFNFNSLAHFGGVFLGANESGLFILGGKDDLGVPIQADIRTGIHDLAGDGVIKLPKEAWLAYRTDGALELGIEVEEDGNPYAYTFDKTSRRITEQRKTLGKGLRQRFYTFILKNKTGTGFDLGSLRILGDVLSKRRR